MLVWIELEDDAGSFRPRSDQTINPLDQHE